MMNKTVTNMERIIAKIDNDFNPDNSDWIPRVAAWTIDALSILKCFEEQTNRKKIEVRDRIAYDKCALINITKVVDANGCEVRELTNKECGCFANDDFFTGGSQQADTSEVDEIGGTLYRNTNNSNTLDTIIDVEVTKGSETPRWQTTTIKSGSSQCERNYVKIGDDKLELSYDTSYIIVESKGIKTECSTTFGCDLPVIPDNGLLIECIVAWCMYKMLCRGYKHPVFNLRDNSPALNPFVFWTQNKDKAKDSVTIDAQKDSDGNLWRSAFYIDTFDPRR